MTPQDGWTDPPRPGKRRKRRGKKRTRNQLEHALAAARDKHALEVEAEYRRMLRQHDWFQSLTPAQREKVKAKAQRSRGPHRRDPLGLTALYAHPDTPEGQAWLHAEWSVKYRHALVLELEEELTALQAEEAPE